MARATKKTHKKTTQRIPRYKDKDGYYVGIFEDRGEIFLAWTSDGYDEGARLVEVCDRGAAGGAYIIVQEENKAIIEALESANYAYKDRDGVYIIESIHVARKAKRLVNAVLWNMQNKKPLPDWAQKAIAEGWSPPKGWRP